MTTQASFYDDSGFVDVVGARPGLDSEFITCEMLRIGEFENYVRTIQDMSRKDQEHFRRFLEVPQCIWTASESFHDFVKKS